MYITKFRFLAQFVGELCEEQIQKLGKNDIKTTFLGLRGNATRVEKSRPPKGTSKALTRYKYQILTSQLNLMGDRGGIVFFLSQKGKTPSSLSFLIDLGG